MLLPLSFFASAADSCCFSTGMLFCLNCCLGTVLLTVVVLNAALPTKEKHRVFYFQDQRSGSPALLLFLGERELQIVPTTVVSATVASNSLPADCRTRQLFKAQLLPSDLKPTLSTTSSVLLVPCSTVCSTAS